MRDELSEPGGFEACLDRLGANFDSWPDRSLARRAREVVLADPGARRVWDEAQRLDELLAGHVARLDADVAGMAIADKAVERALAQRGARTAEFRAWLPRLAASFAAAVVLGGLFDVLVLQPQVTYEPEIVALESFVFGPGEVEIR